MPTEQNPQTLVYCCSSLLLPPIPEPQRRGQKLGFKLSQDPT